MTATAGAPGPVAPVAGPARLDALFANVCLRRPERLGLDGTRTRTRTPPAAGP